jgi:hypothetical protein
MWGNEADVEPLLRKLGETKGRSESGRAEKNPVSFSKGKYKHILAERSTGKREVLKSYK